MKGYVYKLFDDNNVYYGSTIRENILSRISQHKTKYNTCCSKIFNGNFNYEIIESFEFDDIKQLKDKENEYIKNNECINKRIEGRTQKEYRELNKDKIREIQKKWIEENKDKFKVIQKKHYDKMGKDRNERTKIICECGGKYVKRNYKLHCETLKHKNFISG